MNEPPKLPVQVHSSFWLINLKLQAKCKKLNNFNWISWLIIVEVFCIECNSSSERKSQFKKFKVPRIVYWRRFHSSMEMKKKHYSISLSLVYNHITVMEIVNVDTTNCSTGLDFERLKGNLNSALSNLDVFAVNEWMLLSCRCSSSFPESYKVSTLCSWRWPVVIMLNEFYAHCRLLPR